MDSIIVGTQTSRQSVGIWLLGSDPWREFMFGSIKFLAALAIVSATALPAHADKRSEIERALRTGFDSADADRDGVLTAPEHNTFVENLFLAMDANGDRRLTQREFHELSLNLLPLARKYGRVKEYAAARERIRRRWKLTGRATQSWTNFMLGAKNELSTAAGGRGTLTFARFKRARFIRELADALR